MRRIHSLGDNKYVHLDSYPETHKSNWVADLLITLLSVGLASMAIGAIIGVDITNPNATPTHADETR